MPGLRYWKAQATLLRLPRATSLTQQIETYKDVLKRIK